MTEHLHNCIHFSRFGSEIYTSVRSVSDNAFFDIPRSILKRNK